MSDRETAAALARLSARDPDHSLSRRRFLQLALAAGAVGTISGVEAAVRPGRAGARPLVAQAAPTSTLVVVLLAGGNDGLNTLVPYANGTYLDRYGPLAISPDRVLPIDAQVGLHPSLARLKARYDAGRVALVQGVGYAPQNLSHFVSMANWMAGSSAGPAGGTGWVGRYLDGIGPGASLAGVSLGDAVPLHFRGTRASAVSLPVRASSVGFRSEAMSERDYALVGILGRFDDVASDRGAGYDLWNSTLGDLTDLGVETYAAYAAGLPADDLVAGLATAARLVNLDLGVRVIGVQYGDFDTHALQAGRHDGLLARLDAAIDAFYANLEPRRAGRVALVTMSEFGRRPLRNSSDGTDHGGASVTMVIGDRVRGGLYGETPSLLDLDVDGNLRAGIDFRSVYATLLQDWLGGDAAAIVGGGFPTLGFTNPPA